MMSSAAAVFGLFLRVSSVYIAWQILVPNFNLAFATASVTGFFRNQPRGSES